MKAWLLIAALAASPAAAELFVDVGAHASDVESRIALRDGSVTSSDTGLHLALGVRRPVGERSEIGARVELDSVDGDSLLAVRAFDYGFRVSERLTVTAFAGAARLDLATPAYGYWLGGGLRLNEVLPRFDLGIDLRYGDKVARDNLLPSDPQGGSPDNFHDITSLGVYLSYRF